jgi:hypothetical protein
MLTRTFPQANLGKMAIRVVLWTLSLCVMYYRNPVLYISLTSENTKKGGRGGSGLESTASLMKKFVNRRKELAARGGLNHHSHGKDLSNV